MTHRRGIDRIAVWLVLAVAFLLFANGVTFAQTRTCSSADVAEPMRLPDGSEHPAGKLTVCLSGSYSPVAGFLTAYVDRHPVAHFISREGTNEGEEGDRSFLMFLRQDDGRLALEGYASTAGGSMRTFHFDPAPVPPAKGSTSSTVVFTGVVSPG